MTALGVLCLTPDALLVRLIECPAWTLLFWRGFLMAAGLTVFVRATRRDLRSLDRRGWLAAAFLASSTTCFVFSLQATQAANTLVIIATSPLLAGLLAWLLLRETLPWQTWLAIVVALGGVALSVLDSSARGSLWGELLACGSALSMAGHFTALRWWRSPDGPLAVWAAGLLAALVALPFCQPLAVPSDDVVWLVVLGLVVLPVAFGLISVGPRYLPAAEVGLFMLLETVLGPLWVWLALGETPGPYTLVGGSIVVATLATHSWFRRAASPSAEPPRSDIP